MYPYTCCTGANRLASTADDSTDATAAASDGKSTRLRRGSSRRSRRRSSAKADSQGSPSISDSGSDYSGSSSGSGSESEDERTPRECDAQKTPAGFNDFCTRVRGGFSVYNSIH